MPRPQGPVADYAQDDPGAVPEENHPRFPPNSGKRPATPLVVATVPSIGNESIEEAAVRIFEGVGHRPKGKDNGILLLVAQKERKMRIEVGLRPWKALSPDATAGRVRDQAILPYFKKGDFGAGVWLGVANLAKIIADEKGVKLTGPAQKRPGKKGGSSGFAAIFVIIALGIIILRMARRAAGAAAGAAAAWSLACCSGLHDGRRPFLRRRL